MNLINLKYIAIIFLVSITSGNVFSRVECQPKEVFVGRYFGVYQQIKMFKDLDENYEKFKKNAFDQFILKNTKITELCKKHRALLREVKKRNLSYPKLTKSEFNQKLMSKIDGIIKKFLDSGLNLQQANEAFIQKIKKLGFPHEEKMSNDLIYRRFTKAVQAQLKEEIREEQINNLEQILFNGHKDPLLYLNEINKETQKIEAILKQESFENPYAFKKIITNYEIKSFIETTNFSPNKIENIKSPIDTHFINIAKKNIDISINLYTKFVQKVKNAKEKLENLSSTTNTPENEVLKLLYQSVVNDEQRFLTIINLNTKDVRVHTLEGISKYQEQFSHLKSNCPYLYKAITLRVNHIVNKLLAYPSFAITHVKWKVVPYNEIYAKALKVFQKNKFNEARKRFYLKEGLSYVLP